MKVSLFDFDLPEERIAQHPAEPREAARLLAIKPGVTLSDQTVRDLPSLLNPGDLLVVNDTKVFPARLYGRRINDRGGNAGIEILMHQHLGGPDWVVFAKPARKLNPGDRLEFGTDLAARVSEKTDDGDIRISFDRDGAELREALWKIGTMPLPPYIRRGRDADPEVTASDRDDYQTLFAAEEGAVAAPTAGLHFTPALMQALEAAGIGVARLTLHVGAGTFLPVKAEDTEDHRMHAEWARLSEETAAQIAETRAKGGKVIAVGTTALRTLESAVGNDGIVRPFEGETRLFITPGFRFRAVDRLMTNFHLPKSTLFMLVSAFSGLETMQAAYAHAIESGYRFYSYGDACLLDRMPETTYD